MLASANKITTPDVHPNVSEDLSISEMIWVSNTLNDIMVGIDTGSPLSEDAREDVSPVI